MSVFFFFSKSQSLPTGFLKELVSGQYNNFFFLVWKNSVKLFNFIGIKKFLNKCYNN